jgi:hypothetical protein
MCIRDEEFKLESAMHGLDTTVQYNDVPDDAVFSMEIYYINDANMEAWSFEQWQFLAQSPSDRFLD